jgi:glycosyltransferase involved in cell wall biosynthesis
MSDRDLLLDVSRLVWRFWRGGLPTGIDRVCLAYVEHFRGRAKAVMQRRGQYYILSARHSHRLFDLFSGGPRSFRRDFTSLALRAGLSARRHPDRAGLLYLNIGHTGLDEPTLPRWIARNGLRAIFLIHDLIPLTHPEYCRPGEYEKHRKRIDNVLARAEGIIGNSQSTIDQLASYAAERNAALPATVAALIAGSAAPSNITPATFRRPHFIVVGTIEGRKNHRLLLHIWRRLAATHGKNAPLLVVAGQRGWEADQAIAMLDHAIDLKDHVMEYGACDDERLAGLIAGARALLMPSFTEGFGLPVAEALRLGTPVIASDLPVFREFAGEIPTYLDPIDELAWEATIREFAGDSVERARQLEAMRGYHPPDWQSHFRIVEEWLGSLLSRRGANIPQGA